MSALSYRSTERRFFKRFEDTEEEKSVLYSKNRVLTFTVLILVSGMRLNLKLSTLGKRVGCHKREKIRLRRDKTLY
jgi:hypothetical protein